MQQHVVNSDVRLFNHYTHAKFEKILSVTSKDIHHFITVLIWIHRQPKYLENETREQETENVIQAHLEMLLRFF